ncbi:zinc finger protein 664-like [Aricia agestis]|uniref:zinc finger protein 664-like n=1 Tax=Aricia agestis TaxID=91739 RepID=UPI001C208AA3|nr:zinc finger protein 664-like [Aricia agestis]
MCTVWTKSEEGSSKDKIKEEGKSIKSIKKEKGDYFDGMKELKKHYHNIRVVLESTNATPIRSYSGIGYNCCFCDTQACDPADLKRHNLENHDDIVHASFMKKIGLKSFHVKLDITGLQCKQCGKTADDLEDIMRHLIEVHDKKICTDIPNRMIPFKFDAKELRCYKCYNTFSNFKTLMLHMGQHIRNHECEICNAGFIYPNQLNSHSLNHKLGTFECSECKKVFDTLVKLKSHVRAIHSKVHLNKCGCCGELFKEYLQKIKHMMEVHGFVNTNYKCAACDREFWNPKALRIHRQRDHLMERRHACNECDKRFYSASTLKMHMLTHTGIKEHQCGVCLKYYGKKTTLRQHLRIHANDRRYKCEHCGQSFVQKCSWRGHMRSRHGEDV